jgi:hypothetical protein
MSESLYRIKLYGHTGEDKEAFAENLAAVLQVDEKRARSLVAGVPSVLGEGLPQKRAQVLMEALKIIRALVIMEPMEGGSIAERTALEKERDLFLQSDTLPIDEPRSGGASSRMKWAVPVTTLALVLVAVLVLYLGTYRPDAPASRTRGSEFKHGRIGSTVQETSPYQGMTIDELRDEASLLQEEMALVGTELTESNKFLVKLRNTYGMDKDEIHRVNVSVATLRNRYLAAKRELGRVKRRIAMMHALRARAGEKPILAPDREEPETTEDENSAPAGDDADLPEETERAVDQGDGSSQDLDGGSDTETEPGEARPDR